MKNPLTGKFIPKASSKIPIKYPEVCHFQKFIFIIIINIIFFFFIVCGVRFTVDHAMICKRGGFIIQRHNELRDLEVELLKMLRYDVEVEPGLQPVTGEELNRGANQSHDARLDVHARVFWECQRSAYFDIRVCHPHADSYKDLTLRQLYKQQENEKKRKYASRILEVEQGTFTPLVFSPMGGMGEECAKYHARLVELLSIKKGETYSTTV